MIFGQYDQLAWFRSKSIADKIDIDFHLVFNLLTAILKTNIMDVNEIASKADIERLCDSIQELQKMLNSQVSSKEILRSVDVKKLLKISDGTLQRLRVSRELPAKKINGTWFYSYSDILKMMEGAKNDR